MKGNIMRRATSAMLILSLLASVGIMSVSANNHTDEVFTFSFSYSGQTSVTRFRTKEDDSSAYMYCTGGSGVYNAHVVGTSNGGSEIDMSHGYTYGFGPGQAQYLRNWVYENYAGQWNCVAAIRGNSINGNTAIGVWSPDSI